MNFYTLTFKQKLLAIVASIITIMIAVDIALYFIADAKTTERVYIDDKFSKIKHYKLNAKKDRDIVFVGSSRTFFNIASNSFKARGIDVYNFGISGAQFEDYPTVIDAILEHPPKRVVISLQVTRLYDTLEISDLPTLQEVKYYYDIDKTMAAKALIQTLINKHLFLVHSQTIYYKLQNIYNAFSSKERKDTSQESIDYDNLASCKVFDVQHTGDILTTMKCQNGDGVLLGNHITLKDKNSTILEHFNKKSIHYIQNMVKQLHKHHIKVSFVFEPILHNPYHYDLEEIKKVFLDVEIIDLSSYQVNDTLWADGGHFNYKGREHYSKYLSDIIVP